MTKESRVASVPAEPVLAGAARSKGRPAFVASMPAALLAALLLASCASTGGAVVTIEEDTPQETVVSADGPGAARREVRAFVTTDGTALVVGEVRMQVLGHRGYRGELGLSRGEVTIGGVRILYDEREITINGPFTAGTYPARMPATLTVDPSGAVRRG